MVLISDDSERSCMVTSRALPADVDLIQLDHQDLSALQNLNDAELRRWLNRIALSVPRSVPDDGLASLSQNW